MVDRYLAFWADICKKAQDEGLSEQALSSLYLKKFHAQGGGVYALYPGVNMADTVDFIVALQTISDYLDNLCDRAGVFDENAFRQLHISMLDAVDPEREVSDYYLYYPYKNDNHYLELLVGTCRREIGKLPSYRIVSDRMRKYVRLYSELQTYKHLAHDIRENRLLEWAGSHLEQYPGISCWEFSAATGSTLGMFMLFASAFNPHLTQEEVAAIDRAYFPWICGLHILLDYYIDLQEDMCMGDLNFTYYYDDLKQCEERLAFFIDRSFEHCSTLKYPKFHTTVVKGLLAMYLSDPKASVGLNNLTSRHLLGKGGMDTAFYHKLCKLLRQREIL